MKIVTLPIYRSSVLPSLGSWPCDCFDQENAMGAVVGDFGDLALRALATSISAHLPRSLVKASPQAAGAGATWKRSEVFQWECWLNSHPGAKIPRLPCERGPWSTPARMSPWITAAPANTTQSRRIAQQSLPCPGFRGIPNGGWCPKPRILGVAAAKQEITETETE